MAKYVEIHSRQFQRHIAYIDKRFGNDNDFMWLDNVDEEFKPDNYIGNKYVFANDMVMSKTEIFEHLSKLLRSFMVLTHVNIYKQSDINPFKIDPAILQDIKQADDNVIYYIVNNDIPQQKFENFKHLLQTSINHSTNAKHYKNHCAFKMISPRVIIQYVDRVPLEEIKLDNRN